MGGSGFIGTNLVRRLTGLGEDVISIDDYSILKGQKPVWDFDHVRLIRFPVDLSSPNFELQDALKEKIGLTPTVIWHLAANSDIQNSATDPIVDYRNTLGSTLRVIDFSKFLNISKIVFASSSAVYGDHLGVAVSEDEKNLVPTSNYGIMKLASEQLLKNFCDTHQLPLQIFRFPNVIGTPLTHGVIHDLFNKFVHLPTEVQILGDGFQQKPFLHVSHLIEVMISQLSSQSLLDVMNVGPNDNGITIHELAEMLRDRFSPTTKLIYQDTATGWKGDIPRYSLIVSKMLVHFPHLEFKSLDAVNMTINELERND